MISRDTIDRIFNTARIEEVVGDFVQLKKRGVNYIGLCPFHNEKTPSFNVNPVRNIYKCFGCGKGGNPVNFVMEHEHSSYPEALRYLAGKYNIEIEETVPSPEEQLIRDEKESLFIVNNFAQKHFSENLFENEEGRAVGLSYFHERGFSDDTIKKFGLGYSLNQWSAFADTALKHGYLKEHLVATGLCYPKKDDEEKLLDRFRGRVMFPVHNLSGKIIAFGGRILKKDDKAAKYINSPESEIYHKSKSLYGIYFAKKAIVQKEVCYLVEGYTDVISMHQAGIENVVASSGTSLTPEQIRLIGRYTKNITVLYDGDPAGIKASLRGIDLILEEGLNVKIVLLPGNEDPDSYSRKYGGSQLVEFIRDNAKDFVVFKTGLLLQDAANDPVRKAALIQDVVETISKIPDPIVRSVYLKQCSVLMDIQEQILISAMNKVRRSHLKKELPPEDVTELLPDVIPAHHQHDDSLSMELHERHIISLLMHYPNHLLHFFDEVDAPNHPDKKETVVSAVPLSRYVIDEIRTDNIEFENPLYRKLLDDFERMANETQVDINVFLNNHDPDISKLAVDLLSKEYLLSENWENMHKITVPDNEAVLKEDAEEALLHMKIKKVLKMIDDNRKKLKDAHTNGDDYMLLLEMHKKLEEVKMEISRVLGIDVLR